MIMNRIVGKIAMLAAETGATGSDLDTFLTTIKGGLADLTSTNLAKILIAALAVTVGLFLAWFGYRWVVKKVSGGIKKLVFLNAAEMAIIQLNK